VNAKLRVGSRWATPLLVQTLIFPWGTARGQPIEPAPLRALAVDTYHRGRYEEAIKLYEQAVALEPKDLDLLEDLVWSLLKTRHYEEAAKVASRILALRKNDPQASIVVEKAPLLTLATQADAEFQTGHEKEGIKLYKRLASKNPQNIAILKDLMWSLCKAGDFDEARKTASRILAIRKDDREAKTLTEKTPLQALRLKANADFHAGRYPEAAAIYQQIVAQDPRNVSVLRDLTLSLWRSEHYDEARKTASQILAILPDDPAAKDFLQRPPPPPHRDKAVESFRAGRYEEAAQIYEKLLTYRPGNPSLLKDLYWSLWQMGRFEELASVGNQLAALNPGNPGAWNLLGRAYAAAGKQNKALEAYQKSLSLDPQSLDTQRLVGRMYVDSREFDEAIELLTKLQKKDPGIKALYPLLAAAQFFKGQYGESAKNWATAVELYPSDDVYRIQEARALYFNGQVDLALIKLKTLTDSSTQKWPAIDFLVDDALSARDPGTAEKILEENLKSEIGVEEEPHLFKLAMIYFQNGKPKEGLRTVDRYLEVNPANADVVILKGDALLDSGNARQAARVYKRACVLNPYSIRARAGLANARADQGYPARALRAFLPALALDPTDPYLILIQSHYLEESGRREESRDLILKWLKENSPPEAVTVLVYHGITPFERDPMLAYSVHMGLPVFMDHIRALKDAGYTPVTIGQVAAWYQRNEPLPKKPVMITFDDGRLDSFRFGDPVLQKYDMKATMFLIMDAVEGHMPAAYASWKQIHEYHDTGRWDFQAHAALGHNFIPIDSQGRKGLFLINRQWLEKEGRLETGLEWKARVVLDHQTVKQRMAENLGQTPVALAWPEGTYGQNAVTNFPGSAPINLGIAKSEFQICFHQDGGVNVHTRDPQFLTRLEPDPNWTGEELLRQLQDQDPYVLMNRELLRLAAWDERPRKAYEYLDRLKELGASPIVLLAEVGRIHSSLGDIIGGRSSVEEAEGFEKNDEDKRLLNTLNIQSRPLWVPGYTYWEDNQNRQNSIFAQTFQPFPAAPLNIGIDYSHGVFKERNTPQVTKDGVGLSLSTQPTLFQTLTGRFMWHSFGWRWFENGVSGTYNSTSLDTYSASLKLNSKWSDSFDTELAGGRSLYDTALALNDGITENFASGMAVWRQDGPWKASLKLQGAKVSDGNVRSGAEAWVSRRIVNNWRGVYEFTFENMDKGSPDYYSPQRLTQHQLGFDFDPRAGWIQPSVRYLPGVGQESGTDYRFIQDIQAALLFRFNEYITLQPIYDMTKTPTYRRDSYNVILTMRF
jgi:tetratricopeptide (TPR) repeat protein